MNEHSPDPNDLPPQPPIMPGTELYIDPKPPALPNPINLLEDYFGESFSGAMIDAVGALPAEEVDILLARCQNVIVRASGAVGLRDSYLSYPTVDTYHTLAADPLHYNDAALHAGEDTSVPATPGLRQVLLFCDRTLMRAGGLCGPIVDDNKGAVFASRLSEIAPLAAPIRAGNLVLVQPTEMIKEVSLLYSSLMRGDPLVARLLKGKSDVELRIRQAHDEAFRGMDPDAEMWEPITADKIRAIEDAAAVLAEVYPADITARQLGHVLLQCARIRMGHFIPVTSDPLMAHHLRECAATHPLDHKLSPFAPAVQYQMPALSDLPLEDIFRLRDSDAFVVVRGALHDLGMACVGDNVPFNSYRGYRKQFGAHARDVLGPAISKLEQWERKAGWRTLTGKLVGEAVGLGLDLASIPGVSRLGGPAARRLVTGASANTQKIEAAQAARILKTVL